MNSSPKILVFKLRSLIYTLLLLFFGILLIVCLVLMFSPKAKKDGQVLPDTSQSTTLKNKAQNANASDTDLTNNNSTNQNTSILQNSTTSNSSQTESDARRSTDTQNSRYTPGVYTASVSLGDSAADVEVTLNTDRIQAIRLVNLSETTAAAFPLVSPAFEHISAQVLAQQSTDGITAPTENRYTSQLLLSVISGILQRAEVK